MQSNRLRDAFISQEAMLMSGSDTIKAVIWDLGGVIVRTHDHSGRVWWEKRLGLLPGRLEQTVFGCETAAEAYVGRATVDDVWRAMIDQFEIHESERQSFVSDFWRGDRVDYQLVEFIRGLRPQRKTALLSNAWNDLRGSLKEWEIADAFDQIIISAEVGIAKPHPRIYELALEGLELSPQEAVFIDDFELNIKGAQHVGLCTIAFDSPKQAIADLEELFSEAS
jgi:epoxide hydrolase-like predicted phosphatase